MSNKQRWFPASAGRVHFFKSEKLSWPFVIILDTKGSLWSIRHLALFFHSLVNGVLLFHQSTGKQSHVRKRLHGQQRLTTEGIKYLKNHLLKYLMQV